MTTLALCLVLASSLLHATWNLMSKKVGGGTAFIWMISTGAVVIYAPVLLVLLIQQRPSFSLLHWAFIFGSGAIQIVYFHVLLKGYRESDLSLVYPLARGAGPAISTVGAILFLGERPTPLALCGAAGIVAGVFLILSGASSTLDAKRLRAGRLYGLATGACIAGYTLFDKHLVSTLLVPPLLLDYASHLLRSVALAPLVLRRRDDVQRHWQQHRREVFVVALLSPLAYMLVLTALIHAPVSYVAPLREISILIGVFFGAKLLEEGHARRRTIASALMLAGVIALALG